MRKVSYKDEAYGNLLLWKDANQNGKTEDGELVNIQLSPVTAIYLDRENGVTFEQYQENGNLIINETNYMMLDGKGTIRDVGFAIDPTNTITNNDTLSAKFYGDVLSGGNGDDTYLYNLGDGKVTINDNGNGTDTLVFDKNISQDQLLVKWDKNSGNLLIGIRKEVNDESSITEVADLITIQDFFDDSGSIEKFQFADGNSLSEEALYNLLLETKEEKALTARVLNKDMSLLGAQHNDLLYGAQGEEELIGLAGNDFLRGLEGDDQLIGGEGNDVLDGGTGDDNLFGDEGDDAYMYKKGDGRDVILDTFGNDTLIFGKGIAKEDIIMTNRGNDVTLSFKYDETLPLDQRDSIVLSNQSLNDFQIETIEFYDGSVYSFNQIANVDPIVAEAITDVTLQDVRAINGDVGASDEDGDTLTYSVSSQAENGTLIVDENGVWNYEVAGTYIGTDSAIITIDDGYGGTVTKTLNFDAKVSAPTINTTIINLKEDSPLTDSIDVLNPVGGTLTYEIVSNATNGRFSVDTDGVYSYNPNQDYNGTDAMTLKVTNEYGLSTTTALTFEIEAVNDAPTVTVDSQSLLLQNIRNIDGKVEANDIDGDTLSYSVATQSTHGAVTIDENGKWHYKAEGSFNGNDSAVVLVDDGNGGTVTQTLNFTVDGYIYEGEDLIIDEASGNDTLTMTNINKEQLSFSRNSDDLQIAVADGGKITLKNYFNDINAGVETLHTAQGDINLSRDVINNVQSHWWHGNFRAKDTQDHLINGSNSSNLLRGNGGNDIILGANRYDWLQGEAGDDLLVGGNSKDWLYGNEGDDNLYGDAGNDYLNGGSGNDALTGGGGKDRLYGYEGDDFLSGGSGKDRLYGDKGNDTLVGGTGKDYLEGYYGSDTYQFSKGDGYDTIDEWSKKGSSDIDTIKFEAGITKDDISFSMHGDDLLIQYGDNDIIKIKDANDSRGQVEKVELSDGMYVSHDDMELVIQQINAYGEDKGMGYIDNKDIQNTPDLMNIVSSAWHE